MTLTTIAHPGNPCLLDGYIPNPDPTIPALLTARVFVNDAPPTPQSVDCLAWIDAALGFAGVVA